jgi:transcription termination factor Rho
MPVFDRASLEESPLADLHTIASELSIDGYRRLRKAELVNAILQRQGGEDGAAPADGDADEDQPANRRRRGRRGGRGRRTRSDSDEPEERGEAASEAGGEEAEESEARGEPDKRAERAEHAEPAGEEEIAGVVELLPGGSGFVRVDPPEPSDDDVYISAAQVKRCELVSGDRITGPRRPPRRSERFASLLRVDTINGRPASELAAGARFDDLPAEFPSEILELGADPTAAAISEQAPLGRGSRVTVCGPAQSGKTGLLAHLAAALVQLGDVQVWLVLVGVRPEEIPGWSQSQVTPAATATLAASSEAQAQAVEGVIEQARRIAARGSHAVVLIDTLDGIPPHQARRALAAARKIVDGGSLTVIATAQAPLGGETTVIALDERLAAAGKFPAIDPARSWTVRADLLVGASQAEKIARARSKALGS